MEENFDRLLSSWIGSLSKTYKLNFKPYGLDALFFLRGVQLNEPILRIVTMFQDLEFCVFMFGPTLEELSLITEEFEALLNVSKSGKVIYSIILNGYVNSMAFLLEVHRDTFLPTR